ncbi:MAG: RICIN domain-containing protein [Stackebrandtia sp.]
MQSQWNNDNDDVPAKMGQAWGKTKAGAGTGRVVAIAAGVVAVVLVVGVLVAMMSAGGGDEKPSDKAEKTSGASESEADGGKEDSGNSGAFPKKGDYQVVHDKSGLCLTTGPEPRNEERSVIVLGDCGDTYPKKMSLKPGEHRQYSIGLDFTKDDWKACLTVDKPADAVGYLMAGDDCDKKNDLQVFELWDQGDKKYSVAVKKTGMCLGPLDANTKKGTPLNTVECDGGDKLQYFSFKK